MSPECPRMRKRGSGVEFHVCLLCCLYLGQSMTNIITVISWSIKGFNHPISQDDIFHRLKKEQSRHYLPISNPFHGDRALEMLQSGDNATISHLSQHWSMRDCVEIPWEVQQKSCLKRKKGGIERQLALQFSIRTRSWIQSTVESRNFFQESISQRL